MAAIPQLQAAGRPIMAAPAKGERDPAIETLRVVATFLLVAFHSVNGPQMKALTGPSHPLQMATDFLVDVRMPLFAFIAGYVYAARPIGRFTLPAFAAGKARRLLVPGAVATLAMATAANLFDRRFGVPIAEIWTIFVYSYAHFWFLQSIFLILLTVAASEKMFGGGAVGILLVGSSLAMILGYAPSTELFSANGAAFLMPYFAIGVVVFRQSAALARHRPLFVAAAAAMLLAGAIWNVAILYETGAFSKDRTDLQSYAFGVGMCLLLILFPVRIPQLAAFGTFGFTIYLYHVFGTAGAREVLLTLGVGNPWPIFAASVGAGFLLPAALHLLARRSAPARRLVLGLR